MGLVGFGQPDDGIIQMCYVVPDIRAAMSLWIDKRGYGFHHWGRATANFDRDVARYQAQGHELAFIAGVPSGGSVAYMDTTAQLPGYVELIELAAGFEATFSKFYRASIGWDGADPVRSFL